MNQQHLTAVETTQVNILNTFFPECVPWDDIGEPFCPLALRWSGASMVMKQLKPTPAAPASQMDDSSSPSCSISSKLPAPY